MLIDQKDERKWQTVMHAAVATVDTVQKNNFVPYEWPYQQKQVLSE